MSGLQFDKAAWPNHSEDELMRHFELFNQYDLDGTGFISPENLYTVLKAMSFEVVEMSMVHHIIDEVAILSGHDNDGKLSFRDYMKAIEWDLEADAHNLNVDAKLERLSMSKEVGETVAETADDATSELATGSDEASEHAPTPPSFSRARHSSLSVVNSIAAARIKAFKQIVSDAKPQEKIRVFEHVGVLINTEDMHKETLANKIKAFETAAKFKGKIELKKTWRQTHGVGNYVPAQKIMLGGQLAKPPPKKKLSELP